MFAEIKEELVQTRVIKKNTKRIKKAKKNKKRASPD